MRYLYFDEEAGLKDPGEIYNTVYDGLMNSPKGYEGPSENRMITKVFDKLEAIGRPTEKQGNASYELIRPGAFIVLEETEFSLVWETLKVIHWVGKFARRAASLYEWLEKSPDKERIPQSEP